MSSDYTVLSDVLLHREGKRVRERNESSIAASGYIVIIARLVSAADDGEDEREKLKRISPNCRPLVQSLGSGVVCHRRSCLFLSDVHVESERSSGWVRTETIRTLIELHKEKKRDREKSRDRMRGIERWKGRERKRQRIDEDGTKRKREEERGMRKGTVHTKEHKIGARRTKLKGGKGTNEGRTEEGKEG